MASCSTTPRRLPTWTVPDGVLESLTTWGPSTDAASSSAQNIARAPRRKPAGCSRCRRSVDATIGSRSPAGPTTVTLSPFFLPSSARPTGDSLEMRPSAATPRPSPRWCRSRLPVARPRAPPSSRSGRGSVEWFSSMMTAFLISAESDWIRPSTNACSFLASSYSAFSVMSPCSLASWMRVATSGAPHVDHLVELHAELFHPLAGDVAGLRIHVWAPDRGLVPERAPDADKRTNPRSSASAVARSPNVGGL